jgi:hypothetical protein
MLVQQLVEEAKKTDLGKEREAIFLHFSRNIDRLTIDEARELGKEAVRVILYQRNQIEHVYEPTIKQLSIHNQPFIPLD